MAELTRTIILCGLLSGTQPFTIMGLLLVMTGSRPRRNGLAYISGAFIVESSILLFASFVLGDTVEADSDPGRGLLVVRMLLGIALVVIGLSMRRPPSKPEDPVPKAFERLHGIGAGGAFVAGLLFADYQGPVLGSMALASASVDQAARLAALALYTLLATGIPTVICLSVARSQQARARVDHTTSWVMSHRRQLGSWFGIVLGLLLIGDAALGLLALQ